MRLPIRERILAAIEATVDGRYNAPEPQSEKELPITGISDEVDEISTDEYGITTVRMPVVVARAERSSSEKLEDMRRQANRAYADIVVAMHQDETFGGLAQGVEVVSGLIEAEINKFVFAGVTFVVTFTHAQGNPYDQL